MALEDFDVSKRNLILDVAAHCHFLELIQRLLVTVLIGQSVHRFK